MSVLSDIGDGLSGAADYGGDYIGKAAERAGKILGKGVGATASGLLGSEGGTLLLIGGAIVLYLVLRK